MMRRVVRAFLWLILVLWLLRVETCLVRAKVDDYLRELDEEEEVMQWAQL